MAELSDRLRGAIIAEKVWDQILTPAERKQLGGDFEDAYRRRRLGACQLYCAVRNASRERTVIELAHELDFVTATTRSRLLAEFDEHDEPLKKRSPSKPCWDLERRQLSLGTEVIRTVSNPKRAKNIVKILDTFERLQWPVRIDAPAEIADSYTLHKSILSLNQKLKRIRFRGDGRGKGIEWSRC